MLFFMGMVSSMSLGVCRVLRGPARCDAAGQAACRLCAPSTCPGTLCSGSRWTRPSLAPLPLLHGDRLVPKPSRVQRQNPCRPSWPPHRRPSLQARLLSQQILVMQRMQCWPSMQIWMKRLRAGVPGVPLEVFDRYREPGSDLARGRGAAAAWLNPPDARPARSPSSSQFSTEGAMEPKLAMRWAKEPAMAGAGERQTVWRW